MARDNQQPPGPPVQRRYRIDTSPLAVLLLVAAAFWVLCEFWDGCSWNQVLDFLEVHDRERYTSLAKLGAALLALVAAAKVLYRQRR